MKTVYVPILKGKKGELDALKKLKASTKNLIQPLVEIPPVPWNFIEEAHTKSVSDHVAPLGEKLVSSWGNGSAMYLDSNLIDSVNGSTPTALLSVAESIDPQSLKIIPVTGISREEGQINACKSVSQTHSEGACIRIEREDMNRADLSTEITNLIEKLLIPIDQVDLLIDMQHLADDQTSLYPMAVMGVLFSLGGIVDDFRSLTIAGASFPPDMSDVSQNSSKRIPRKELEIWNTICSRLPKNRWPRFGDYAVSHPTLSKIDPRIMSPSASIRYTIQTEWLILKGRSLRRFKFDQFHSLSKALTNSSEFCGEAFSAGDEFIHTCGTDMDSKTGNLTTWRFVGTNHHIEYVTQQLASQFGF